MLGPLDFTYIQAALASPGGWIELAMVAACFAVGWMSDRRVRLKSPSGTELARVGSVNRLVLPFVTLGLLILAAAIFRTWRAPFFLTIAIPLTVALALIRLLVYAAHELFGAPTWMPLSERVIAFLMW